MSEHPSTVVGMVCAWLLCGCAQSFDHRHAQQPPAIVSNAHARSAAPAWTTEPAISPEATSLLGEPLYPPDLPDTVRTTRQRDLDEAQIAYDRDPHDEVAIIWLGRRQAYLGHYRAAIDTFSNGLAITPDSPRLLRHRGHRWITVREFDRAIDDLTRAADLIEHTPDEVEPDGQPNARNIPTSTLHTNVHYHLALAHYLKGQWRDAALWYQRCFDAARNDDMRIAAMYWLYLSLKRDGRVNEATQVLQRVSSDMDIIENVTYHRLLRVFAGESPAILEPGPGASGDVTIDTATIAYGLGARELLHGDAQSARRTFNDALRRSNWAAFGHIAAEAELARMRE